MDDLRMINISLSSNGLSEGQYAEAVRQQQLMQQLLQSQLPGLALRKINIREVAMALPKDGILIEFQKYREFTSDFAGPGKEWGGGRYLAFILSPEQKVTVVELGPSSRIDDEINAAISASSVNNSDAEVRWSKVSKSVLGPVLPYIRNQAQIFISPDAELHKIPFSAILLEEKVRSIIDSSVQLRLLSSGRDLVKLATPAKAGKASMVIASPDFDALEALVNTGKLRLSSAGQRSTQGLPRVWTALPNSLYEGKSVAALLNARLVTGHAATTRAVQSQDSPRILHIASHGNFVTESHGARDSSNSVPNSHDQARGPNGSVDPLLSSYVVLAGANSSGMDPTDDGLLTALEATSLQLNGTELVVLSACSTAQGNLQSGEGLYGMQRAFMVAGARSTLLSMEG